MVDCTISVGVGDLLQVQEVCCHRHITDVGIVQDLDFDSPSKGRELFNEGDLLVPLRNIRVGHH